MRDKPVELSVIVPSFKDVERLSAQLPPLRLYLDTLNISYEILICDDGSRDGGQTEAIAKRWGCRYLESRRNEGKGAAVRRGMLAAVGKYHLFTDSDIPFEFNVIQSALWHLDAGGYDMVVGDRTLEGSQYYTKKSWLNSILSHIYSLLVFSLFGENWFDTQCGFKGFRSSVSKDLFSVTRVNRFAFDVELLSIAVKRRYEVKRLPVVLRNSGKSHVHTLTDGPRMCFDVLTVYLRHKWDRYREIYPVVRNPNPPRGQQRKAG